MPTPLELNWSNESAITTGGFTQDTGGINVTVSYQNDGSGTTFQGSTSPQYVNTAAGETFATTSSLQLGGDGNNGTAGDDQTSTTTIDFSSVGGSDFSSEVENVTFRINDFDTSSWIDIVTVRAYDANGNLINVDLTWNGSTVSGTPPSLVSNVANGSAATETGSILVEIAGPVSYFEIDYENGGTGGQALWVTDIHFDAIDLDGTVEGSAGDDVIDGSYILDPDGDKVDAGDEILAGYGVDGDLIEAYGGDDTVLAGAGDDSVYAGTGNDSVSGGTGDDTVFLEDGNDTFGDWSTDDGNDTVYGGAGDDFINAGSDDDEVYGGADDDVLIGAAGNDSIFGGTGDDEIRITDDHDTDVIEGGEDGDGTDFDALNFYNFESTDGVSVTATGDEAGTYDFDGTDGAGSYTEIEGLGGTKFADTFNLAADNSGISVDAKDGDDVITTGAGDDVIDGGAGADTFDAGAGNDQINLGDNGAGSPDGDADVIILEDGFGDDIITNFDAPIVNLDGSLTGVDTLVVTNLSDGTNPVNTNDVTVTDDGSGNSVLSFPNGESITLIGIDPADADDPMYLNAIGIPLPDGTVSGTAGDDTIDTAYIGDPDGDIVDNNDAILAGDVGDDDLIEAGAGNDTVLAGLGDDEVYGGAGDDEITGGAGDDTLLGEAGNDTFIIDSADGTDEIIGGENVGDTDTVDFTDSNGPEGVDVVMTGDESGTYSSDIDGGSGTFDEIEAIDLTDQDDTFDGAAATGGNTVTGGDGEDVLSGSSGSDSFDGGADDDIIAGLDGEDTIEGGDGDDIITGDAPAAIGGAAAGDAGQLYLDVANVQAGSETGTPGDAQVGDSVIFDDAGTLPDGTIISVKVTVVSISDPDVTVDLTNNQSGAPLRVSGNGDPTNAGSDVQFKLEFFDQATGLPITIDGQATVTDIDNNGGAGEESVSFADTDVTGYTVGPTTSIIPDVSGGTVSGSGTTTNNAVDEDAWFGVNFEGLSELNMTVSVVEDTANYGFSGSDITGGVTTVVDGGADDSLSGGAGNDEIYGNGGDDILDGGDDDDTLYGGSGQDTLTGGEGADTLIGGADEDEIFGSGGDVVDGSESGTDNDTLYVVDVANIVYDPVNVENGTVNFNDGTSLTFTNIENVVTLNDGTVSGTAGDDLIDGSYLGDPDGDIVDNNDAILPGDVVDDDLIEAGAGNDSILAGNGDDEVYAGADNDTVAGGLGNDTIFGEDGNDTLVGDQGDDTLFGGAGDDTIGALSGGVSDGNDTQFGGAGDDTIFIGNGADTAFGGDDADTFNSVGSNFSKVVEGGEGGTDNDTLSFAGESDAADTVDVTFTGDEAGVAAIRGQTVTFSEIENIIGTQGDDSFDATNATTGTNMSGEAGDDSFVSGEGDDTLFGGTGNDSFAIGDGDGADQITGGSDAGDGDIDTVDLSSVTTGGAAVTFTGDEAGTYSTSGGTSTGSFTEIEQILGTDEVDVLDASANGDDITLSGNAGDDTITGGTGDDVLTGGDDSDTFLVQDNFGDDTIVGGQGGNNFDTLDLSALSNPVTVVFTGPGAGTVTDTVTGDVITFSEIEILITTNQADTVDATLDNGNTAISTLEGNDSVLGSAGDDVIDDQFGGSGADGQGNDTFFGEGGNDLIWAGDDDDTVFGGTGNDTLNAQDGNDVIDGGLGNDTINAGSGDDEVTVGGGVDTAFGGSGDDLFIVDDNDGTNVIEGGETGETNGDTLMTISPTDATVTSTGDEAGVMTQGTTSTTFSEIETINTDAGNDTVDISNDTTGMTVITEDGTDTITGGSGGDVIDAGADDDVIDAGAGDDTVTAGTGDDDITLGDGTDTGFGGAGDDTFTFDANDGTNVIEGGETGETNGDILTTSAPDNVTVTTTGDEAGTLTQGTTTVDFSEIEAIETGAGDDSVNISNDTGGMTVTTNEGADVITGGSGDDVIDAGADDDTVTGGQGSDTITAGSGDDTVTFADGDDVDGGSGDDLFVLEDLGEASNGTITIDGGAGDETGGDTLQLGGLANLTQDVIDTFVDDGTGSFSGSVTLDDGTILNFSEIENIICFTPGTRIVTPNGLTAIEDLEVGDMVVTRDHGLQPIRWIEGRCVPAVDRFAPVRIRPNVLAGQERDLIVSPQHRVLFSGYRAELLFGESEVLVAAKHLVDGIDVTQDEAEMVTYVHMLFDQHEVIYAEGAATESFHPGDIGFSAVGDQAREELFAIFPELRDDPKRYGNTARRCLKAHEAQLIRL